VTNINAIEVISTNNDINWVAHVIMSIMFGEGGQIAVLHMLSIFLIATLSLQFSTQGFLLAILKLVGAGVERHTVDLSAL
jgi:hypothetical protein